ncbi:MAG: hypothetical protein DHS20C17_26120 [Cyclobacteriaceae bacterium]|nr:MAG: hypothetical protein DHS20C17_26120 [Cyclobacteriaceae bacterium]
MFRLTIVCCCLVCIQAPGQSTWTIDSAVVNFHIKNAGIAVTGSFSGMQSDISFNPKKLKKSSIKASVDSRTVSTGIRIRDKHLLKPEFFDSRNHSIISMESKSFQKTTDDQFEGIFMVNIKGNQKSIPVSFTYTSSGALEVFSGSFEIDRNDFEVGGASMLLADKVTVEIWLRGKAN